MTEEALPSRVLEHEIGDQHRRDDDGKRHPEAGGPAHHQADDIREEVPESDPGSGPEQRADRRIEPESFEANGDHAREPGRERVQARQKLCQDDYRTRCATNRSLASRTKESGSSENRHRVPSTRAPWDRPSAYHTTSAPRVAAIAAATASARRIWPEPDRTPAPSSMGTAGAGTPACTTNAQRKSTTTPCCKRISGIEVPFRARDRGACGRA